MFAEDLSVFINTDGFAESATLGGVAVSLLVNPGYDDTTFSDPGPAGSSPNVILAADSVPPNPAGLRLVILTGRAAGPYNVTHHEPDGNGLDTLYLTKTT